MEIRANVTADVLHGQLPAIGHGYTATIVTILSKKIEIKKMERERRGASSQNSEIKCKNKFEQLICQ